ncbi:MaoC family dehydratase [Fusobacterium canifelinum]|uniref:MaoC family dehydratase n=1 Tax=Fusobacterium canifelinum TaxID=285729 RepID=A0A7T9R146_9FUSO|nr:MaoC family dehydratase [Fusobacterium canifelinum]QQB73704.1 MaoC family dehydratase [Fusobacterium canifelinum]QQS87216.1 MaoC family dehydratase [Fusobacterium canifelinum]
MEFESLKVGMSECIGKTISEADILSFAGVSLDVNPLHLNEEYAKTTIFKGRIAHGIIGAGLISAVIGTKLPGEGTIYLSQNLNFLSPVKIGDTITAKVEILELNQEKKKVVLKTTCTNQDGILVIDGEAKVLKK